MNELPGLFRAPLMIFGLDEGSFQEPIPVIIDILQRFSARFPKLHTIRLIPIDECIANTRDPRDNTPRYIQACLLKDLGSRVYALIVALTEQQLGGGVRFPRMVVLKIHPSQYSILVDLLRQVVYTRRLAGVIAGHHVEFQTRVGLQGVPVDVHSA